MTISRTLLFAGLLVTVSLSSLVMASAQGVAPMPVETAHVLTLEEAVNTALKQSPILGASSSRADAATASLSQAEALPNPELSIEAENIFGDGPYKGTDAAEMTYGISQQIEVAGKRSSRISLADNEKTLIHFQRDAARLDLIRDITVAYTETIFAEAQLGILAEQRKLAALVRDSVAAKVEAGKEPPIQKNKAEIELSSSEIALEHADRNLTAKTRILSTLMGQDAKAVKLDPDSLPALIEPETLELYRARLSQTPEARSQDADVLKAQSTLSLEKANAVPDPTFSIGVRQFKEDDQQALVAGLSVPLPVFNLNRAGIKRAGHEVTAAQLDQKGAYFSRDAELTETYQNLVSAYRAATSLKSTVLPGAEEAFSFARQGYEAGKFGYLEVLDAQRTLFEVRQELNNAVLDYYRQLAAIERLSAIHSAISAKDQNHAITKN